MDQTERIMHAELLRFITCGSVDDGKSTVIGRLLYDSKAIFEDQLAAIAATSQRRGLSQADLALLTDGLQAEREQGITIDVAYRYFSTPARRFIIADTPGHEQYTRNMVTGASTADLAVILVDARRGVLPQTRRHAHLVRLLGISQVVLAVNKMDLAGYDEVVFSRVRDDFLAFADPLGFSEIVPVPMSALEGDMVVERGEGLSWYKGPTLLQVLERAPVDAALVHAPFRFPVQRVERLGEEDDGVERRGFQGRIESGTIAVGDSVVILPAGVSSIVASIQTYDGPLRDARAGQSVTLTLADQVDISRGDTIAASECPPRCEKSFEALVCWFSATPFDPARRLLLRHGTRTVRAKVDAVACKLDVNTSAQVPAPSQVVMNDIVRATFRVQQPLAFDAYETNRPNGSFILIDEVTNDTVAAGMMQ
ncbi:MAG: sulfate adenylyltransferase [Betaproteobacteria bacterium]|nr:sulfate adenylyltransferase [Betaproteobacteria bacterium]